MKQATISANWGEENEKSELKEAEVTLNPKWSWWIWPKTSKAVIPWTTEETKAVCGLISTPYLSYNMSIVLWNARGIGRPGPRSNPICIT